MIRLIQKGCFLLIGLFTGCGQGSLTSNPGIPPPHNGQLIILPGSHGFVEVVKASGSSGKTTGSGKVAFYFLKDMTTPFSPAPSTGTLTIGKKKVTLNAEGDGLVTPSGPSVFGKADLDGVLSVELEGKSVNIPLGVR